MEARLPDDKLTYLGDLLDQWSTRHLCTLRDLQELTGFLQFASQVIPASRAFIRRLLDFSSTFPSSFTPRRIPRKARCDIQWWRRFSSAWNGVQIIKPSRPTLRIFTDASGKKGLSGVFETRWFSSRVGRRRRRDDPDIQYKEMAAVLEAVLRWGSCFRGHHVIFMVDNQPVVSCLEKSTIRHKPTMGLMRTLLMLAGCLDFTFSPHWISTDVNALADAASHFQYARLFSLKPDLDLKPSSRDPQIIGIKATLTSPALSPSTFGTVSPAPPAAPTPPARRATSNLPLQMATATPATPSSLPPSPQSWSRMVNRA